MSDRMEFGALRAAAQLGLKVLKDLSVVGFGDKRSHSGRALPPGVANQLPLSPSSPWQEAEVIPQT